MAAECYALLARCGGGGSQGVKHAESWGMLCQRLIGSLNDTLTALLQAVQMGRYISFIISFIYSYIFLQVFTIFKLNNL